MPESTEWQQIAEIPVDTARIVLVDPRNLGDALDHEEDLLDRIESEGEEAASMNYEVIANERDVGVALVLTTGLGDGVYPVEARFEEAEGAVRIAEIRVRFLPHPLIGYELPR